MKKILLLLVIFPITLLLFSFNQEVKRWDNKDFEAAIDEYCKYLDSTDYKKNFDFVYVEASKKDDKVEFVIWLSGGSNHFIHEKDRVIDFFNYKGYDILLKGDFPNEIVNIKKNKELNVMEDIVKNRYRTAYDKYIQDNFTPPPLIYDYMNMTLVFNKNHLILYKRESY